MIKNNWRQKRFPVDNMWYLFQLRNTGLLVELLNSFDQIWLEDSFTVYWGLWAHKAQTQKQLLCSIKVRIHNLMTDWIQNDQVTALLFLIKVAEKPEAFYSGGLYSHLLSLFHGCCCWSQSFDKNLYFTPPRNTICPPVGVDHGGGEGCF